MAGGRRTNGLLERAYRGLVVGFKGNLLGYHERRLEGGV